MKYSKKSDLFQLLVFLAPAILFFALMKIIPFFMGMYYSFTDWNGISAVKTWVGFNNFIRLFQDEDFSNSFIFTAKYTVVVVIINNLLAFLLAFLLTRKIRFRNPVRTVIFMPNVIGGILLGFIWLFIFTRGFPTVGKLTDLAFFNLPWLGTENTAFWGIIIVSVWQFVGYLMVIYVAGILSVPHELIEAADMDGATSLQKVWHIILPLIMPVITVCMFLTLSTSFKVFDVIYSLTKGGPFRSTEPVALNIYTEAFGRNNMGLGSAKAFIFFVIVALLTLLQVWFTKRKEVE
ncbi:carbohydrate ABC transporter permease [Ammoniphilus sp. CFH 90114]|uniref:carbohydrate ABC transporter permease n=1 Tax=Ammoniphilus sp. CFH 90114 TaxID=2493665 RepID=UPI00100FC189|nr:sugar ABC transporter permease [Ammoniphilus sp. CFH 90114]RXT03751.1 sugar ABC transporter permease [Ammoniphilus sp. CFH 90114]